jgi:hypothetical protein
MLSTPLVWLKSVRQVSLCALAACGFVGLAGCSREVDVGHVVAVSGRILINGEPLRDSHGTVTFIPDLDKGNSSTLTPSGTLDNEGRYILYCAQGKKGAAPGWYKVEVSAAQRGPGMGILMPKPKGVPGSNNFKRPINSKYASAKTSGLRIEVVETPQPGAYDLKLTR